MSVKVFAGLPWLAGIVVMIFTNLMEFFLKVVSKKVAIAVAAATVLVTLTGAFMAAAWALVTAIVQSAPAEYALASQMFIPSNVGACMGAIASAHVLRYAYDWQVGLVKARMYIT